MVKNQAQRDSFIEEEIDLSQYWRVINRRKWSILSLAFLISLLTALIVFSITPVYQATTTLLIEPQQPKLPSVEQLYGLVNRDKQYYLTQLHLLKSRRLAVQVIHQLKLDTSPEFAPHKATFDPIASLRTWLSLNEDASDKKDRSFDMLVTSIQNKIKAKLIKDTQLITISFDSESPELAANFSNALAEAYVNDQLSSRIDMTRKAATWMEQRLKILKRNLADSEQGLQAYKERYGLIDIKGVSTLTAQELNEQTIRLVTARSKYIELGKRYGPKHPKMIAARSELRASEAAMTKGKSKIQSIDRKAVKLRELKRQVDSNQNLYDTFLKSLKETSQAIDLHTTNARISDPAIPPILPFKPKKKLIISLAFFASLMMGVLLAFLYEAMDKTFKGTSDIEEKLGQPILGLLPLIKTKKKDRKALIFAALDSKHVAFAEALRTIRTGLMLSGLDNPHKVVLVTSSIPGEGKTVVATSLAISMAKMERVLLLGADLRRPKLARSLGLNEQTGLTNIVAGVADAKSCIHHMKNIGLDVLPCGQIPPNPLELLSSKGFARMIEMLENHYDRIVIDSPPLQAVSDALVLSKYAKAVVYVIEADSTHEHIVQNGIKRLQQYDASIVGIILNKFDAMKSAKYGYEYGGYYDQYGYSSSEKT